MSPSRRGDATRSTERSSTEARTRGAERGARGDRTTRERGAVRQRRRGRLFGSVGFGRMGVLLALSAVTVLVLVLYFTPLLGVRSVRVQGNRLLGEQEVRATAEVPLGESMLRVDTDEIRDRLRGNPKVASARVVLSWPSMIELDVTERAPAAFVRTGGTAELIDPTGVPFVSVPAPPAGLPEVRVPSPNDSQVRPAVSVLASLPPDLRGQVVAVSARSTGDLRLSLVGDREVWWGSLREPERKAAILSLLLTQPGKVYNVTSPDLPTVT